MSELDDLALYLENNNFGVRGTSIFLGIIPSEPRSFICITQEYGYDSHKVFGIQGIAYDEPRLIVLSKDPLYQTAYEKCDQVYRLFGEVNNQVINETFYLSLLPEMPPYFFEMDAQRDVFIGFYLHVFRRL